MSTVKKYPFLPPRSLEALRSLVENSAGGADLGLGQKALAALVDMIQSPHRAAVQNISEVARNNGVDPSTLTRLGQKLGFHGFPELQELFRIHVVKRESYYSNQIQQLLGSCQNDDTRLALKLADQDIKNVLDTASSLDEAALAKAVELLTASRRIYILGLRASFSIAHFFGYFLGFLRRDVVLLGGAGFTIAEDLARMSRADVLVAISFRPYTNVTVAACKSARSRNVPEIAITDLSSPIAQSDEAGVTLASLSPYYFNSALANFFLVQALLAALAQKLGLDAIAGLEELEDQFLDLDIEID